MLDFASLKASDVLQAIVSGLLKSKNDPLFENTAYSLYPLGESHD